MDEQEPTGVSRRATLLGLGAGAIGVGLAGTAAAQTSAGPRLTLAR